MITEKPWREAANTKIWNVLDAARRSTPENPADAGLGVWFVFAPWMHMAWSWHYATLIHLRDIPGTTAPVLEAPDMTHEFMVFALHPDHEPSIEPFRATMLDPVSIAQQFKASTDAEALDLIERALEQCVAGRLSIDSDYRPTWRHILVDGCETVPRRGSQS